MKNFIIPAIDLIGGKCVRLSEGNYNTTKVYYNNPLEAALMFEEIGCERLHVVDLDGAKAGKIQNIKVLQDICKNTKLKVDFSGGIKTNDDIESVFDAGASFAAIGSIAVKDKDLFAKWINEYGADKIILGADVKDNVVKISGWLEDTKLILDDFLVDMISIGVKNVYCTDISKDGLLQGASTVLYKRLKEKFPSLFLIASGGIASLEDVVDCKNAGCDAVIVGKAIYEEKISKQELINYINLK